MSEIETPEVFDDLIAGKSNSILSYLGFGKPKVEAAIDEQLLFGVFNFINDLRDRLSDNRLESTGDRLLIIADHCIHVVDTTATFLSTLANGVVAVSLKLLWGEDGAEKPIVHTVLRSSNTRERREEYSPIDNFPYDANTAFDNIARSNERVPHFASDRLFFLSKVGKYRNDNQSWRGHYSKVAVVGIPAATNPSKELLGYLCADASNGSLNNKAVLRVLEIVSSHLYDVLGVVMSVVATPAAEGDCLEGAGWRKDAAFLSAANRDTQRQFQSATALFALACKFENASNRKADDLHPAAAADARLSLSSQEGATMSRDPLQDYEITYVVDDDYTADAREARTRSAQVRRSSPVTFDEAVSAFQEMAKDNPYAADVLKGLKGPGARERWAHR